MVVKCIIIESFNENKMRKLPIVRFHLRTIIYTLVLFQSFTISTGIDARVEFHVDGSGFHRNFTYRIKLSNFTEKNCHAALFYELPSALYVNINELADLRRLEKIEVCSVGETDIESFTENANSQNVSVCASLKNNFSIITLPIHQRYRYPKEDGAYEDVILKKPNLLIGCETRLKEYRISKLDLCPSCATLAVKWREIPYVIVRHQLFQGQEPLEQLQITNLSLFYLFWQDGMDYIWTIPIGNISFLPIITFITLSITVIGTIFLMKTIWKASSISSQKYD